MSTNTQTSIISNPFVFIGIIALIASLILSFVSESTSERVDSNKKLDIMKNVLLCRYLEDYKSYEDKLSIPSNIEKEYDINKEDLYIKLQSLNKSKDEHQTI